MTTLDTEGKRHTIEGTIIAQTDLAVFINDGENTAWLPKSEIEIEGPDKDGLYEIDAPVWLLQEEGLI